MGNTITHKNTPGGSEEDAGGISTSHDGAQLPALIMIYNDRVV